MTKCLICEEPINGPEIVITPGKSLCLSCGNCSQCDKQVTIDEIKSCLNHNSPIRHQSCARVPRRRCIYLDEHGQQCETWFLAVDTNKLCVVHREIISPNGRISKENTPKYIDLVNDERKYCYHFQDGTAQNQEDTLIFQFHDDSDGTREDKIDARIAFFEKIIEDIKAHLHTARAIKSEDLDSLSEEERKERQKVRIDRVLNKNKPEKIKSFKSDPISNLMKKQGMSKEDASDLLNLDFDALMEKFARAKELKEGK